MEFMNAIKNELDNATQLTENGAVGYCTTGTKLLDLNFAVPSLRCESEQQIIDRFIPAFFADKVTAIKWLFFVRDVREGMGERRLFRIIFRWLAINQPDIALAVVRLIPEYGRYDDLFCALNSDLQDRVIGIIESQLQMDIHNALQDKPISLCAKWLPSENASSLETKQLATLIRKQLGWSSRDYRKRLSKLRAHIDVVEKKMSAKEWNKIDYEKVPSKANLIYKDAFLRNDKERRIQFLQDLEKGEAKINASVSYPCEIVHKYLSSYDPEYDATLEEMWKALPDLVSGDSNTMVVADGSGSMTTRVGTGNMSALSVANSLAIYFAERASGSFKDKYITFSEKPQFVDLSNGKTLLDKLNIAEAHDEVANTNIAAVFDLILNTAVKNNMVQEQIPKNILIVSDMEFDGCAQINDESDYFGRMERPTLTFFDEIKQKYLECGYQLPRLVFWNVNSRTNTIPVKENELGVALVSGYSINTIKMVMSGKLDPYECLLDMVNAARYNTIETAIENII